MILGPNNLFIIVHISAQWLNDLQKFTVFGVKLHFYFNSSANLKHNSGMVGKGSTKSLKLGRSGGSPIMIGSCKASREITLSNVLLVAVAVRAKILTRLGSKLLTFPIFANAVWNSSPLDNYKIQCIKFVITNLPKLDAVSLINY